MNRALIISIAAGLIVFGMATRLLPHAPNATALTAIALVSSLYLGNRFLSFIIPAIALVISDALIGFYDWKIMTSVYISFALGWALVSLCKKKNGFGGVGISLASSSILFFLITNGAVWLFSPWYEKSIGGLLYAYELGLPFLRNMFVGDFVYTWGLIAVFEAVLVLRTRAEITYPSRLHISRYFHVLQSQIFHRSPATPQDLFNQNM